LAQGAEPLLFLDYFATGKLNVAEATEWSAHRRGLPSRPVAPWWAARPPKCRHVFRGDYDLAGFSVGAVERGAVLPTLDTQKSGDVLIALGSSGPHSNGYSLVRRVVERSGLAWDAPAPFAPGKTLAEALMAPTRIYIKSVLPQIKAAASRARPTSPAAA